VGSIPTAPFLTLVLVAVVIRFVLLTLESTSESSESATAEREESTMGKRWLKVLRVFLEVAKAIVEGSAAGLLLPV
jgi:hypothetical protein